MDGWMHCMNISLLIEVTQRCIRAVDCGRCCCVPKETASRGRDRKCDRIIVYVEVYLFRGTNRWDHKYCTEMFASWSWRNVDLMKPHFDCELIPRCTYVRPVTHMYGHRHQHALWGFRSHKWTCSYFEESTFVHRYRPGEATHSVMRCDMCQVPISFAHIEVKAVICASISGKHNVILKLHAMAFFSCIFYVLVEPVQMIEWQ